MHKQLTDKENPVTIEYSTSLKWDDVAQLLDIDTDGLWYTDDKVLPIIEELENQLAEVLHRISTEHKCLSAQSDTRSPTSSGPKEMPSPDSESDLRRVKSYNGLE